MYILLGANEWFFTSIGGGELVEGPPASQGSIFNQVFQCSVLFIIYRLLPQSRITQPHHDYMHQHITRGN